VKVLDAISDLSLTTSPALVFVCVHLTEDSCTRDKRLAARYARHSASKTKKEKGIKVRERASSDGSS
jgi:hypothetical protein